MKKAIQEIAAEIDNMLRFEGASILGNSKRLLLATKVAMVGYLIFFYFTVRENPPELIGATLLLIGAAFLPAYLWCSGKVQGLPILPIIALKYIPSYAYPVQVGMRLLLGYTPEEQTEAVFATSIYLLLMTLVWQQICNRTSRPSPLWFSVETHRASGWMLGVLGVFFLFQIVQSYIPPSLISLFRGVLVNGSSLACFILAFQAGQKRLTIMHQTLFLGLFCGSILIDAGSLILASSIVKVGVVLAGFALARGRVPWKSLLVLVPLLWILHAGKSKMREEYWEEGVMGATKVGISEYPRLFGKWLEIGWRETVKKKTQQDEAATTAAERGSLLNVFLRIYTMTPSQVPYLDGLTYQNIPKLLVPRFLNKDKGFSHVGNLWLAYVYKFVAEEGLMRVSIQFDIMMEAFANYGFLGMAGMAILLGMAMGWVTRISTGVPIMSFRFLFAVLFLNSYLGGNNTLGVFVSTLWQGTIGLLGISWLMMRRMPNPIFEKEKREWEEKRKKQRGDPGSARGLGIENRGLAEGAGSEDSGARNTLNPQSTIQHPETKAPVKHERPTRFVYGKGKKG